MVAKLFDQNSLHNSCGTGRSWVRTQDRRAREAGIRTCLNLEASELWGDVRHDSSLYDRRREPGLDIVAVQAQRVAKKENPLPYNWAARAHTQRKAGRC